MGHPGFNRQWAQYGDQERRQHGGRRGGGPWGAGPWAGPGGFGRPGHPGPPPWVAGLFGLAQGDRQRGPRVRRGDVRSAILDVVRTAHSTEEPVNGYQVIQQITERSNGAWRPSPGSVYPTISQLEDEGLVETDDTRGRRSLRLTAAGETYVAEHADELAAVWVPFEQNSTDGETLRRPQARDRPGHGRGVADHHAPAASSSARPPRRSSPTPGAGSTASSPTATTRPRTTEETETGRPMSDEQLRISDAEREQAAAALGEHYAQGRLTADEHAERLDQIWAASTRAELPPVFRDLPGPARRTPTVSRSAWSRRGRFAGPAARSPRGAPGAHRSSRTCRSCCSAPGRDLRHLAAPPPLRPALETPSAPTSSPAPAVSRAGCGVFGRPRVGRDVGW